jgi:hypothetical protein
MEYKMYHGGWDCNRPSWVRGQERVPSLLRVLWTHILVVVYTKPYPIWVKASFLLSGCCVSRHCLRPICGYLRGEGRWPENKRFYEGKTRKRDFVHTELFYGSIWDGRGSPPVSLLKRCSTVLCALTSNTGNVSASSGLINKQDCNSTIAFGGVSFVVCIPSDTPWV